MLNYVYSTWYIYIYICVYANHTSWISYIYIYTDTLWTFKKKQLTRCCNVLNKNTSILLHWKSPRFLFGKSGRAMRLWLSWDVTCATWSVGSCDAGRCGTTLNKKLIIRIPSGKHTKHHGKLSFIEKQLIFQLKVVMFHGHVRLPEGNNSKVNMLKTMENHHL